MVQEVKVYSGLQVLTYKNGRFTLEPTQAVGWSIHVLGYVDIVGNFSVHKRKYNPVAYRLARGIIRRLHGLADNPMVLKFLDKTLVEAKKLNLTYSLKSPPTWWDLPTKW